MNTADNAKEIGWVFHWTGFISSLKKLTYSFIFEVVPKNKTGQRTLKGVTQWDLFFFKEQVDVVGHEAPCIQVDMFLFLMFKEGG